MANPILIRIHIPKQALFCSLWREHLGLEDDDMSILDPVCDQVYHDIWVKTAQSNTRIYDTVFPKGMQDSMDVETKFHLASDQPFGPERLDLIRGNLIRHPVNFLKSESLDPKWYEKETFVGAAAFQ